ncbi:MAG TPA: TonB-dependent receptor [Vicinamibacterales bacterium]|nr:TonB-dependent receptor [Vicinamibacterales bacterium]
MKCAVLLLALGLAAPAAAQRTTGEIIGKVVDESGSVLPGVTVTLRGAGVAGTPSVVTSETGTYRFPVLPPGTYTVEYVLPGFTTLRREAIPVDVGAVVELDVAMKVGTIEEAVIVTGESPVVNLASSQVSTAYNHEWVMNAPVRRFSYFDLINSAPGVSATSNVGQSTAAQSLGNSTNENSYQIDGTDISSTPWPNTDAVETVEVLQLGASAEYGNVQGAVFNIVTRMGGNVFHGDANFYFQNNALTGRNTTDASDRGLPYHRDTWRDATIQATGPFMLDKFWFFGSLEYQRDWDSQPGTDPKSPVKNDSRRVFWKFNYNLTPQHRLMHGYHNDYYFIPDITNEFTAPSSISLSHGDNPTPNLVYTGVLSDKTFVEARYSGFWLHSSTDPNESGVPRVMPRFEDQDTGQITGGITQWTENRSWRYGLQTKVSHLTGNVMGGTHEWKGGLQFVGHGADTVIGNNDDFLTYSVTHRPTTGTSQLPYHQGSRAQALGLYVDDTYRIGNAVVNAGLRYDYSKGLFDALPFLDAQGNPTGQESAANNDVYHWNTVSPRIGINYKVNSSGKTLLKAHFGRYYKLLEAAEFRPAVPSITTLLTFGLDAAGNRINVVPTPVANVRIDPNFKSPYSNQFIAQIEQELVANLGLQVNYVHKYGEDYGAWQDITGQYVPTTYSDNVGIDATGQPVTVYRLVSNPADRVFLQTNPAGMYMRYNGVTMMATKRMSHNWQGVVSLVLSKAEGRLASSARFSPVTSQSSLATAPSGGAQFGRETAGPNDFVNTEGRLVGDRPVVAKAQLIYRFPWGVLASGNWQHQSGRFYSRQVRVGGLGFPAAVQINMESNTGDRRVADVNLLDARVQKEFTLSGSPIRFDVFMDALNVTNSDQFESVGSSLGTSSAFGVPTRYIPPRRLQLGAKIRW